MMRPLDGVLVLDFSQFLAGPWAAMRVADLGARVIKIERAGVGDLSRQLTLSNLIVDGDSSVFHSMNRNKESYAANLKDPRDLAKVKKLISQADVLIENFRPGTMDKLGLGWEDVQRLNSKLIYASVTGYGKTGEWKDKPGQDLLIQSLSGLTWLNGNTDGQPVPFGLSIVDMFASAYLVQGIESLLVRRARDGFGGTVEISLLEAALDFQFEVLTTYFNDGGKLPIRSKINNAHAYLAAPYGVYQTDDGYLALAMGSVVDLGRIIGCADLVQYTDPEAWFTLRDEIKSIIAQHLKSRSTAYWLSLLEPAGCWCSDVLRWDQLVKHEGFTAMNMVQVVKRPNGSSLATTRCPIRVNGKTLMADKWAPAVGEDTSQIDQEFKLEDQSMDEGISLANTPSTAGKPLQGIVVLDFSQFLSGPSASLRLADLGARVIKIERPDGGDICRQLYISNTEIDGDSTLFHAINRNKESFSVNLKDPDGLELVRDMIGRADVLIQNFRPGVMERIGLSYEQVRELNPRLIYGTVTGYGLNGPLRDKPGQDLLVQSLSGLPWLNGNAQDPPVPFGLSVADMSAGAHLVQGILAALFQRYRTGLGSLVEVSLFESVIDLQFEVLTAYLNDGGNIPQRSSVNNAHAYLSAPYGIYETVDGYIALAMGSITRLAELLKCDTLHEYREPHTWFTDRDEIKRRLQAHLRTDTTGFWLSVLEPSDYWCSEVLTWDSLVKREGYQALSMAQSVSRSNGVTITTTRCPFRIDGTTLTSALGAPKIGEHNDEIIRNMTIAGGFL